MREQASRTVPAAFPGGAAVSQLEWTTHGYLHTDQYLTTTDQPLRILTGIGSFEYVIQHQIVIAPPPPDAGIIFPPPRVWTADRDRPWQRRARR